MRRLNPERCRCCRELVHATHLPDCPLAVGKVLPSHLPPVEQLAGQLSLLPDVGAGYGS